MRSYINAFKFVLVTCAAVTALSAAEGTPQTVTPKPQGPLAGKVDRRLIPALQSIRDGTVSGTAVSHSFQKFMGNNLPPAPAGKLPLSLDVPEVNDTVLKQISATGAMVIHSSAQWNTVMAAASMDEIDALSQIPGVRSITLAHKPTRRQQGLAANQGDGSMKADQARAQTNLTGAGQKVGVVSDFINKTDLADNITPIGAGTVTGTVPNATITGLANQNSGDLPASIQVIDFGPDPGTVVDNYTIPFASNEGAAMMEVIHDVAPGASFAFASGYYNQTMMAANLTALRQAGCTITVDDFAYPDEPFFQDGPIAQAIRANVTAGVPHFVAVGNDGDAGVLATYSPINGGAQNDPDPNNPTGNFFHNWNIATPTPGFLPIDIPADANVTFIFQWNQPFSRFGLGAGSSVDLDMYLYDGAAVTSNILGFSNDPQFINASPSGDPLELIDYSNTSGATKRVYLAVNHFAGTRSNIRMRLVIASDIKLIYPSGGTGGMTAYGHATVNDAISVGAVFFGDIDSNGAFPLDANAVNAEDFSSKGGIGGSGVPYYFDTTGAPLPGGQVFRDAPDISAPDGGNTTFFGDTTHYEVNGVTYGSDQYQKFFGTSAAASNAAAVAALVLQRASMTSPAELKASLKATAIDVVAATPFSNSGTDDRTGAGRIDAFAVINAMPGVVTQPQDVTINAGQNAQFSIVATGNATLFYQWQKNGANMPGEVGTTLAINNVPGTDDGTTYRCIVRNTFGKAVTRNALLTVNQPPEITQHPQDQVVNLGGTATFRVTAIHSPLTYQWQRNNSNIPGALLPTYSISPVKDTDDNALFRCIVTNPFGSATSNPAKLIINPAPGIVSGPTATPPAANIGQPITFSAMAVAARDQLVTYTWNFGDGTSGTGASVAHAYAAAQKYTVTLTVTDQSNASTSATVQVYIFVDNDGDNMPDLNPIEDNAPYVDATQILNGLTALPLDVKKMSIGVNFSKGASDTMSVSGTIPIPAGFLPFNQRMTMIIGGVGRVFLLDTKAKAVSSPNGSIKLTYKKKTTVAQFAKYTIKLAKADIKAILADEGIVNKDAKAEGVTVRATIFFNSGMYDKFQPQTYTAKRNKTGKTK